MWGETLFGIDEDQYDSDYIQQISHQMNKEMPREDKMHHFKSLFDEWLIKIENSKKLIPEFKDQVARRLVDTEISKVENQIGLYDVMNEDKIESEEFFKIANIFSSLWAKLSECEKKVTKSEIS